MRLPLNRYEVQSLTESEDLSNAEIARRLCLSAETVRIRLYRARAEIYEHFDTTAGASTPSEES